MMTRNTIRDTGDRPRVRQKLKKIKTRKILNKTEKLKKLLGLLEEDPEPPKMHGLPKIHKPNIPMRPITSGIVSAPHRLEKCLAKPLWQAMGSINSADLKNYCDLISKLKDIVYAGKKLVSFDVTALFTIYQWIGLWKKRKNLLKTWMKNVLPVRKRDFVELIYLCVNFGAFVFSGEECEQHRGLQWGVPSVKSWPLYIYGNVKKLEIHQKIRKRISLAEICR